MHGHEVNLENKNTWDYFQEEVSDYKNSLLYKDQGPWPAPAPGRALSEFAEVLHFPDEEQKDWDQNLLPMYRKLFFRKFIPGLWWAYRSSDSSYTHLSDEEFNTHLCEGMYSKFLTELDDGDVQLFESFVPELSSDLLRFKKMDFSSMEHLCGRTIEGTFAASTIGLFEKIKTELHSREGCNFEENTYKVRAIHIYVLDENRKKDLYTANTLSPEYSKNDDWELSKYYLLQGASHRVNMTEHGLLHFPFDSINAITKSTLPTFHPIFKLLIPHFRLALPVNYSVLEGASSMLSRTKNVLYSPFAGTGSDTRRLIVDGYIGRSSKKNAYPKYTFSEVPNYPDTSFGSYLYDYFNIIHDFVEQIIQLELRKSYMSGSRSTAERDWEFIALWAQSISEWVPGFPNRNDFLSKDDSEGVVIGNREKLTAVVAYIIWSMTVAHAADHIGFGNAGPKLNVFRLRVKPPLKGQPTESNFEKKLVKPWDLFQSFLANELFYKPHNICKFEDVSYDFSGSTNAQRIESLNKGFIDALRKCDEDHHTRNKKSPRLSDVSSSIQY